MPTIEIPEHLYEDADKEAKVLGLPTRGDAIERRFYGYLENRATILQMQDRIEKLVIQLKEKHETTTIDPA